MKSHPITKALTGLIASAMLAAVSHAEVTLSDFSSPFALTGTYVQWDSGTFTSGATAFTVQANDFGGGFKVLAPAINASGEDTISIKLNVNPGNVANKFNIVLIDGDGTERAFRFDGVTIGSNQTLTKNVANFLQDNAPGSVPGLNLANLSAFHIQGTFSNGNPGQAMDMTFDKLSLVVAPFVPDTVTNGDFEIPGGTGWATTQGTPTYQTFAGNPNGNGVLASSGGFAVLYAFNNTEKTFASLGLAPGDTYIFQMDMKVISGSIGGIRLEGPGGYVVDQFAPANTGGADWATYSFELTVPASPAQAKFGLRTPDGSTVAFDNVMIVLPPPAAAPTLTIATGNLVAWTAPSAVNTYQVQDSPDNSVWTNLGPLFTGNSVTSVFDATKSPFYQVLETTPPTFGNGVLNPGFETSDFSNSPADNWNTLNQLNGGSVTVAETFGAFTPNAGSKMLIMEVHTPSGTPPPAIAEVRSDRIAVTGGTSHTFSFQAANVVKTGGSNPQFSYFFFDGSNQVINPPIFTSFASVGSAWTLVQNTFTPPAGTASMTVGFFMPTGAEPDVNWVSLIDDVSLPTPSIPGDTTVLSPPPTSTPAVEVSFATATGRTYQAESSVNLSGWANFGGSINGNGQIWSFTDTMALPSKFYRILQTTP